MTVRLSLDTDVIIIGAGPTGLSLACQLIRHGIGFVIVDEKEDVTPFSKALGVHARTLEIYEQLGLAQPAVAQGTIAGKVCLVEDGQIRAELDFSGIGQGQTAYPFMLVLEQSKNERLLYDWMRSHGRDVLWQTAFDGLTQTLEAVAAQLHDAHGAAKSVTAKYLVGCDGAHSGVRHALGLKFEGSTFERLFYVADVVLNWEFGHDALLLCLVPNSIVAFFPLPGENRFRIVGAFPEGIDKEADEVAIHEIKDQVRAQTKIPLEISAVNWFSAYKVHSRHVESFASGRCFLAGDSAHIHTPAGGQGMNTGIQDAYNLAWKLAFVMQGHASAQLLDSYNQERLANARRLLATTDRMFSVTAGTDWLLNLIRTTIFPPLAGYLLSLDAVKQRFFPIISQIGITYRDDALSRHGDDRHLAVKAGDRMPYCLVDGASLYDRLHEPKFHLLAFSDGQSNYQAIADEIEHDFASMMDYHVVPLDSHLAEIFGAHDAFNVFVRPDNHIAFISRDTSLREVRKYLQEVLGAEVVPPACDA